MSVYTALTQDEIIHLLSQYNLGELVHHRGIKAGIENTNYFITSTKGEYILTIFEHLNGEELSQYILLLNELSNSQFPCTAPQETHDQKYFTYYKNKPVLFVTKLDGSIVNTTTEKQCYQIGKMLAQLHTLCEGIELVLPNRKDTQWRIKTTNNLIHKLPAQEAELLITETDEYNKYSFSELPTGIIHSDLFRDNVLFENDNLTGFIDFYDACYDILLYDLAITVNDWCADKQGNIITGKLAALLSGYQSIRKLQKNEKKLWAIMLRFAAMRFWLSRLDSQYNNPPVGEITHVKDPKEYQRLLSYHRKHAHNIN